MDKIAKSIPVSINVSRRQFTSGSLVEDVLTTLQQHSLHPEDLTIEVSDFAPGEDQVKFLGDLSRLQRAGVRIAIDDFGAGWSAIAELMELPIQVTKIARAITNRIVQDNHEPLLDAVQMVTRTLGHETVVQGVENEMQLDWLRAKGWTHAQGYHLSKPMDPEDMTAFLVEHLARPSKDRWGQGKPA